MNAISVNNTGLLQQAGSAPRGANDALSQSYSQLVGAGYQFMPEGGGATPTTVADALALVQNGNALGAKMPNSQKDWIIDTEQKLHEYVFSETGQTQNLPEDTQKQLALLAKLKRSGTKFYSNNTNTKCCIVKAVPLWLMRGPNTSLWAEVNNGNRVMVTNLEDFAHQNGVQVPNRPAPSPAAAAPAPAQPFAFQPPPGLMPAAAPVAAPTPQAVAPQQQPDLSVLAQPAASVAGHVAMAATPAPMVHIVDLNALHTPEPVEEEPEVAAAASQLPAGPNVFEGSVISPLAMPQLERASKAKKVDVDPHGTTIVKKEFLFILPPGQDRLTKVETPPSEALTSTLQKNGVSFIYLNVLSPNKSRLDNFQKKHPLISKLIDNAKEGVIPSSAGVVTNAKGSKGRNLDMLIAMPGDYDDQLCAFPPNIEMASALAMAKTPVAFVRLSGATQAAVEKLNTFVRSDKMAGGTTAEAAAPKKRAKAS